MIFVGAENFLNVRSGPGLEAEIVVTLEANATGLQLTGASEEVSGDRWVEVELGEDSTGWASSLYLTQQVPAEAFCSNARIRTLGRDLVEILQSADYQRLADLVNPQRGLFARTDVFGYEVSLAPGVCWSSSLMTNPCSGG